MEKLQLKEVTVGHLYSARRLEAFAQMFLLGPWKANTTHNKCKYLSIVGNKFIYC